MQDIQESLIRMERKGQSRKWLEITLVREIAAIFYKTKLGRYNFIVGRH